MTNLRVKQVSGKLKEKFEKVLDLSDINDSDAERETKVLTRCLAAFAIQYFTDCREDEAAAAVWDGKDDNGIDAAFFDEPEEQVIFIQAKWRKDGKSEASKSEVTLFCDGIWDAIENRVENFAPRLHGKITDIATALSKPGVTIKFVIVTTGASQLAPHAAKKMEDLCSELNGDDAEQSLVESVSLGLSEVFSGLSEMGTQSKIDVDASILDWSFVAQPYPAYFGVVDGYQLKQWWTKHGKRLVARNIRHALGLTEVNNQIRNTALTAPENFWYFNNGITLVADEAAKAPALMASKSAGNFSLRGASIVNGAQTVSTLAKVDDDEKLGLVRVPMRVILLKSAPPGFGSEVTRTNNLQNRVEARDFVAEDEEQKRIRSEMLIEGIEYQYLRSGDFVPSETSCELNEVTTALACSSKDVSLAVAVKTGIGRFFLDLNKAPYKTIFNSSTSGARAFNAVRVHRAIEGWIDVKKKNLTKKSGFAWGVLIHGNRVLEALIFKKLDSGSLDTPIGEFKLHESPNLAVVADQVHSAMVQVLDQYYPGKFLAVLFKSPSSSKDVYDKVLASLPK